MKTKRIPLRVGAITDEHKREMAIRNFNYFCEAYNIKNGQISYSFLCDNHKEKLINLKTGRYSLKSSNTPDGFRDISDHMEIFETYDGDFICVSHPYFDAEYIMLEKTELLRYICSLTIDDKFYTIDVLPQNLDWYNPGRTCAIIVKLVSKNAYGSFLHNE